MQLFIDEPSCVTDKNLLFLEVTKATWKENNKKQRGILWDWNVFPFICLANSLIRPDKGLSASCFANKHTDSPSCCHHVSTYDNCCPVRKWGYSRYLLVKSLTNESILVRFEPSVLIKGKLWFCCCPNRLVRERWEKEWAKKQRAEN